MRFLVLGGTKFVGRHLVEASRSRGHEVTLFNRGLTDPDLFPDVEQIRGDRDGDVEFLRGRAFDVVIDTSGYEPRVVEQSAQVLKNAVDLYVFVSTISVYSDFNKNQIKESASLLRFNDSSQDTESGYGALKVGCEEQVRSAFGERSLIVRPGLIVGPHDPTNRFTYWVTRIAQGGTVLAPAPPDRPVQFIDARDLAEWMVSMVETGRGGTFNAVGPSVAFGDLINACIAAAGTTVSMSWVDSSFLARHGVKPWTELPLWIDDDELRGFMRVDASKAVAAGLRFRPLLATVIDTLAWARTQQGEIGDAGLSPERERELLTRLNG